MAEATSTALASGCGQSQEYTMVRRDGTTFDAEQSATLLWDASGEPQGVVSITRDITDRRRARRETLRFQALAENAVDAIMLADFAGRISYANAACLDLFGYVHAPYDLLGRSIANCWPEDQVLVLLEEVLPAAGAGGWRGEVTQMRRDGSSFDASLTFFAVSGERGEPLGVATIVRDITERKRAETDLRRFAIQLRTAADVSAQVTTILDPTRLLEAVVPLVQERFGLYHVHVYTLDPETRRLVMRVGSGEAGRLMREAGHTIGLDQEPSLVAQAARSGAIVWVDDVTQSTAHMFNPLLPKTRSEVAIPMITGDAVIGVFDVQDAAPGRFDRSEVDVFSALAGQIAVGFRNAQYFEELQQVAERLREVDRLKSEFLANMSHELRTPLNSILGYAELLQMGIDGALSPSMLEDVNAIFENGQQLLQLINDILDLTKIEAGRMNLTMMPVAIAPLLEEARVSCMGLLHRQPKPVEVVVDVEDALPPVVADPMRLAQVLNNLLSNAIKFTDTGEIRLHARHDPAGQCVLIDVVDTGIGISAEDLARLFERFRQIDGSTTRRAEGTGLGLAISRHLVEMHGGTLTATSELGCGSVFTVSLPLNQPAPDTSQ
jgi:PAS domain S-box-containing protein